MSYDPDANAAYIFLKDSIEPGEMTDSEVCDVDIPEAAVILQFDSARKLIGIEILGCRTLLPEDVLTRSIRRGD